LIRTPLMTFQFFPGIFSYPNLLGILIPTLQNKKLFYSKLNIYSLISIISLLQVCTLLKNLNHLLYLLIKFLNNSLYSMVKVYDLYQKIKFTGGEKFIVN